MGELGVSEGCLGVDTCFRGDVVHVEWSGRGGGDDLGESRRMRLRTGYVVAIYDEVQIAMRLIGGY